jgi:hypothetical protein
MKILFLIILIILIIIISYYLFKYKEKFQYNPNIIKGQELEDIIVDPSLPDIFVGGVTNPDSITYTTKFYLKIFIPSDEYYLNNGGTMCDKNITSSICLKRNSDIINEVVFKKKESNNSESLNSYTQSGQWQFYNLQINNTDYVYYGHEVIIRNLSNNTYLSICDVDLEDLNSVNCGTKLSIYCYNNIDDAMEYGKWIIIPKYFDEFKREGNYTRSDSNHTYDFYETYDHAGPPYNYDIDELKNTNIQIKNDDNFLIINSKLINDKYAYLNFCDKSNNISISCSQQNDDINKETSFKKAIATLPTAIPLANFDEQDDHIYNWGIEPILFDVNVYDTIFVEGSITLGDTDNPIEITSDTLKYIKQIPFHFNKEICLQDKNGNNPNPICINKEHIEMLNGSRAINIKSVTIAKPFILYSSANYTGRELRVGFEYGKLNNLPYIGGYNEWLNWTDNGKWYSLKIEGSYSAIIFSHTNFGAGGEFYDDNQQTLADIQEILNANDAAAANAAATALANPIDPHDAAAAAAADAAELAGDGDGDEGDGEEEEVVEEVETDLDNNANANANANDDEDGEEDAAAASLRRHDAAYDKAAHTAAINEMKNARKSKLKISKLLAKNPNLKIIDPPGVPDVRTFGNKWVNGIRSMILRYKDKTGKSIEIVSNNIYEMKCIEKYPFNYVENISSESSVNKNLFTANLCKNGNTNQNFFLSADSDSNFTKDDSIYDEREHQHFHKHDYSELHDDIISHQ